LSSPALAELEFVSGSLDNELKYVIVSGKFEHSDDLSPFMELAVSTKATAVAFDSPGGSVYKAIELGHLIRLLNLSTFQPRELNCASACALAFIGGVTRIAEPGAIGVHQSSFSQDLQGTKADAVEITQRVTADILSYFDEMGVDPKLLTISLQTGPDDMRYLSGREMAEFRVTTPSEPETTAPTYRSTPPKTARVPAPKVVPQDQNRSRERAAIAHRVPAALNGWVRHPKGKIDLKLRPAKKSPAVMKLRNGMPVRILGSYDRWYQISTNGGAIGFAHHTWIKVAQFDATSAERRLIQIKSFQNYDDALTFSRLMEFDTSIYLANNGWYAITLGDSYLKSDALSLLRKAKSLRAVPDDSFITMGNTYAVKVCCSN